MFSKTASLIKSKFVPSYLQLCFRNLSTTPSLFKVEDRKMMLKSMPAQDEGTQGANTVDIDNIIVK